MSRPINEPYPEQDIARNKFAIKDTRQHVEATRWYVLDDGVITINPEDLGPALQGSYLQLGSPNEEFAFRLSRDGSIQTKGMLDASGATTGDVAWTMPGPANINTDPYLIPFADGNEITPKNQAFGLRVTTSGDDTGTTSATGYIDSTTGDVSVRWGGAVTGPYAMIVWGDGATIADDTPTTLASLTDFDYGYISDPALLSVNLTTGRIILDPTEGPGTDTLAGLWIAHLKVIFNDNWAGDIWGHINWTMGTANVLDSVQTQLFHYKCQGASNVITLGEMLIGTSIVIVKGAYSGNNAVTGTFKQVSGTSQDLGRVVLTVERLETYPATAGVLV